MKSRGGCGKEAYIIKFQTKLIMADHLNTFLENLTQWRNIN